MSFDVSVDVRNPGQFFACCGLFELASRLDPSALAHFERDRFIVACAPTLPSLLDALLDAGMGGLEAPDESLQDGDEDGGEDRSAPIRIGPPFALVIDWWRDRATGAAQLKTWAGQMNSTRIAQAMLAPLREAEFRGDRLFEVARVVYDPANPTKKVEPFYFDARRAPNAHSRDVGFSPNDLRLTTLAFPAVEVLCLVGLQRFRPVPTEERRVFDYSAWNIPLAASVAPAVVAGAVRLRGRITSRFEAWFRTGQKKHKAFRAAVPVNEGE